MKLEDLTDEMIEQIDSGEATIWDGEFKVFEKKTKTQEELETEIEINKLQRMMEEMANLPQEELGKRQPGERGTYERQNASQSPTEARTGVL